MSGVAVEVTFGAVAGAYGRGCGSRSGRAGVFSLLAVALFALSPAGRADGGTLIDLAGVSRTVTALEGAGYTNTSATPADLLVKVAEGVTNVFSGTVGGNIRLVKTGRGVLELAAANDYRQGTLISDGLIRATRGQAFGSGAVTSDGGAPWLCAKDGVFANDFTFSRKVNAKYISKTSEKSNCAGLYVGESATLAGTLTATVDLCLYEDDTVKPVKRKVETLVNGAVRATGKKLYVSTYNSNRISFSGSVEAAEVCTLTRSSYNGTVTLGATAEAGNALGRLYVEYESVRCGAANVLSPMTCVDFMTDATYSQWNGSQLYLDGFDQTIDRLTSMKKMRAKDTNADCGMAVNNENSPHATLTLKGTRSDECWARILGSVSVIWDAADPSFTQTFMCPSNSTMTGAFVAQKGGICLGGETAFRHASEIRVGPAGSFTVASTAGSCLCGVSNVTVAAGGRLALNAGVRPFLNGGVSFVLANDNAKVALPEGFELRAHKVTVDGADMPPGTYTGAADAEGATTVPWLEGAGRLVVEKDDPGITPVVFRVEPGTDTIAEAFRRVVALRAEDVISPIVISLAGGVYDLPAGCTIGGSACSSRATLTVCAEDPANRPVIRSCRPVTGWTQVLPADFYGRTDVWSADASAFGLVASNMFFSFDGKIQRVARWPNRDPDNPYRTAFAYADANSYDEKHPENYTKRLAVRAEDAAIIRSAFAAVTLSEGWAIVRPRHGWSTTLTPVTGFNGTWLSVALASSSGADDIYDCYRFENYRPCLDAEGEWYLDQKAGRLYFIPPAGVDPNTRFAAVSGAEAVFSANQAERISFENLEFTCCRSAAQVLSSVDVAFRGCLFHDCGAYSDSGITMSGRNLAVTDSEAYGFWGLYGLFAKADWRLNGSKVDERYGIEFSNNYLHNFSEQNPQSSAIWLADMQGCRISHNLIHDIPRYAIVHGGRLHEVSYNRIRHINFCNHDSGAIYGGSWVNGVGTRICYNHITESIGYGRQSDGSYRFHDNTRGIYCDEGCGGVSVYGNYVEDCHTHWAHLHSARYITLSNNVFVSTGNSSYFATSPKQLSVQTWYDGANGGMGARSEKFMGYYNNLMNKDPRWANYHPCLQQRPDLGETNFNPDGTVIRGTRVVRNVYIAPDQGATAFYRLPFLNLDPSLNLFDENVYSQLSTKYHALTNWSKGVTFDQWQAFGQDVHSVVGDPGFGADGRFANGSPAKALGIADLPLAEMGLTTSVWRTALPVEADGVREHPHWIANEDDSTPPYVKDAKGVVAYDAGTKTARVTVSDGVKEIEMRDLPKEAKVELPPTIAKVLGVDAGQVARVVYRGEREDTDVTEAFSVRDTAGGVSLTLDPNAAVTIGGERITVRPEFDAETPLEVSDASFAVSVRTIPGVTYQLTRAELPTESGEVVGSPVRASAPRARLDDSHRPETKAFYRVVAEGY